MRRLFPRKRPSSEWKTISHNKDHDRNYCINNPGYNRGKVFQSIDGSGATFISSVDIHDMVLVGSTPEAYNVGGYMFLRDGTVYGISNGLVSWIRDRNGNKISFDYDGYNRVTTITDSINRQVTIVYDYNEGGSYGTCDKITYKGFNGTYGTTRVIRISKTSLGNVLRSGYSLTNWGFGPNYNPTVVSAVWLPDADGVTRRYQFQYNTYAELARVVLPTGGAYEYDIGGGTTDTSSSFGDVGGFPNNGVYRRVHERRVYADGTNLTSRTTYSLPETQDAYLTMSTVGYVTVQQYDASNNLLAASKHYFSGSGAAVSLLSGGGTTLTSQTDGREYQTDVLDTNGTTVLRRSVSTWAGGSSIGPNTSAVVNARVTQVVSTIEPSSANLVSKQTFSYDQYNNKTDIYEYAFGSGSAGSLMRHTVTSYLTTNNSYDYACDPSSTCGTSASLSNVIHIRNLPSQVTIYDSNGTLSAGTSYEYDNYASDTNHAGLAGCSSISGLDSGYTTSYTKRGNSTGTTRYLLTSSSLPNCSTSPSQCFSAYAQYDVAGNVVKAIDGRGYATTFDYTDNFGVPGGAVESNTAPIELSTPGKASYAFATKVTNALNQSAYVQFDYYLGKPVDAEDANGIVASGYYNDALDRPTQIRRAVGVSGVENQTTFAYDDANRTVTTTSDLTSNTDNTLLAKSIYDQLGRKTETRQYETSSNYIVTKHDYDALGHAYRTSNPYRPWNSESAVWTTLTFDGMGRPLTATTPDGAVVTTSYSGNTVTATDQAGKARKSVTDALDRLTTVYEDPSNLNYSTGYTYDVLNNLTQVSQGSQTRTFAYDSLKRMTSAANPESGTVAVNAYDNNGNVLVSTDARGVSTHTTYDELNRPMRRWFNNSTDTASTTNGNLPSPVVATDEVNYFYDSQTLPSGAPSYTRGYSTGALVAVTYGGGSAGTYRGFDEMGRVVRQYQRTDSVNYLTEATYYVNSSLHTETYPSVPGASDRRTVTYTPDNAGRLSSLSSSATSYAAAASVSSIGYASQGALVTETYGNSLIHAVSYNNRLQPSEIKLGTSSNSTSILDLTYSYTNSTTANNGDVLSVSYSGGGLSYTQTFTYDPLNRLLTSIEKTGSTTNWSQNNHYDQYGNRQIDYGGSSYNLAFGTSTNRITTNGYVYDDAGNLRNDGSHAYYFDAEGKIAQVDSTSVNAYVYDGEGRRIKKLLPSNDTRRFIYGVGGQLVAEYDASGGNLKKEYIYGAGVITIEPNSNGTQYGTGDHLGSPRVITTSSGTVASRHDYMPFGEELGAGVGGRTTGIGFSNGGDTSRKQFTGYERDTETGLDFAQARFYGSSQGRFTSPDPFSASAVITNPQTFNRYAYVGNNPVNSTDPSGLAAQGLMSEGQQLTGKRGSAVRGMHDEGMAIIAEEETKYEQHIEAAALGLGDDVVTEMISDPPTSEPTEQENAAKSVAKVETTVAVEGDPKVTAVRIVAEQMNEPAGFNNKKINGEARVGIGVHLVYSFYDQDNKPLNATVVENVKALEGDKVTQNKADVPLVEGKGSDFVTNSVPNPTHADAGFGNRLMTLLKSPFTTKQELTLNVTLAGGAVLQITQERNLTNNKNGVLNSVDNKLGDAGIPGYQFSMGDLKARQIGH